MGDGDFDPHKYQDWTSCEMHGHIFQPVEGKPGVRACEDCHERTED
jgi:hypothetical protein